MLKCPPRKGCTGTNSLLVPAGTGPGGWRYGCREVFIFIAGFFFFAPTTFHTEEGGALCHPVLARRGTELPSNSKRGVPIRNAPSVPMWRSLAIESTLWDTKRWLNLHGNSCYGKACQACPLLHACTLKRCTRSSRKGLWSIITARQ